MKIAIDPTYQELANKLKQLGHEVVNLESQEQVDAVLYNSKYEGGFLNNINTSGLTSGTNIPGVLLIDIKNMNAVDIDQIIRRRLYTPLF